MSSPKTRNAWGLMAKVESTYGTPVALAGANDGVLTHEIPEPDFKEFLFDGNRGQTPGGAGNLRAPQVGRVGKLKTVHQAIGGGAAYSASVFPPGLHAFLRASGFEATGSFGGGAEKWAYAPEIGPTGLDSLTMEAYLEGQLFKLYGAYGNFSIEADGPVIPLWTFDWLGIGDAPTDVAIPAITYPPITRIPPRVETIITIGTYTTALQKGFTYNHNRDVATPRGAMTPTGHAGYCPGTRNPTIEVLIEKVALHTSSPWTTSTTINPYRLMDSGTQLILSLSVGTVQYNRWKLWSGGASAAAQAQVVDVDDVDDGPRGMWALTIEFKPSTPTAQDDVTFTFD